MGSYCVATVGMVSITSDDIAAAYPNSTEDVFALALGRATGSTWHMTNLGVLVEVGPCGRTVILSGRDFHCWEEYRATGVLHLRHFRAEATASDDSLMPASPRVLTDTALA